ncbi:hypothetical protein VIGAN_06183900 [Vigna angularis var. angularis]|uniref:Uncharacterized protein n=1 Tax=Vigna angularis var. angularis TaxID=157739 RepID=A0A0S3SCM8_PHAAN|nr:hypothetical protein VIGAN_06183900 [Vigna angularis var. angularis]
MRSGLSENRTGLRKTGSRIGMGGVNWFSDYSFGVDYATVELIVFHKVNSEMGLGCTRKMLGLGVQLVQNSGQHIFYLTFTKSLKLWLTHF